MEDLAAIIAAGNDVIETTFNFSPRLPGHGRRMLVRIDLSVNATTLHHNLVR
jgi:hypothetical protein